MTHTGSGCITGLKQLLTNFSTKNILLVTGKSSYTDSPYREIFESNLTDFNVYRYYDFDVNPKFEDLIKGADFTESTNADVIIGIGGGSVLDTAKLLSILPSETENIASIIRGETAVKERKKKLILIPTTSGSGSEATHFAVAYIGVNKFSVASTQLLPDAIFLDANFTITLSKSLTAITAFDAFAQAIESFWATGATKESRGLAAESIKIILTIFAKLLQHPDIVTREKMMEAAHLAGKAINISKTTGPHALSYALTQQYGIPHGLAVMLTLSSFWKLNVDQFKGKLQTQIDEKCYSEHINDLKCLFNSCEDIPAFINKMILSTTFSNRLSNYGVKSIDISKLCSAVNVERLSNNPVLLKHEDLVSILNDNL